MDQNLTMATEKNCLENFIKICLIMNFNFKIVSILYFKTFSLVGFGLGRRFHRRRIGIPENGTPPFRNQIAQVDSSASRTESGGRERESQRRR